MYLHKLFILIKVLKLYLIRIYGEDVYATLKLNPPYEPRKLQ